MKKYTLNDIKKLDHGNVEACVIDFVREKPNQDFDYALIECSSRLYRSARKICSAVYEGQSYYKFVCMPFLEKGWMVKFIMNDKVIYNINTNLIYYRENKKK